MCTGSETVEYLRLIDSCITQLKAQGPARTCNESITRRFLGSRFDMLHVAETLASQGPASLFFFITLKPGVE